MGIKAKFQAVVYLYTSEGSDAVTDPEKLRFLIGEAIDKLGLQEEIDYTLEIKRLHDWKGRLETHCSPKGLKS